MPERKAEGSVVPTGCGKEAEASRTELESVPSRGTVALW